MQSRGAIGVWKNAKRELAPSVSGDNAQLCDILASQLVGEFPSICLRTAHSAYNLYWE